MEKENEKLKREYEDYKDGFAVKLYNEYRTRMQEKESEYQRYVKALKAYNPEGLPDLPSLPVFFRISTKEFGDKLSRFCVLNTLSQVHKLPYNILEGENKNYYYVKLRELIVSDFSDYQIDSLELSHSQKNLVYKTEKEYNLLKKYMQTLQEVFRYLKDDKWKEALATASFLDGILTQIEVDILLKINFLSIYILCLIF